MIHLIFITFLICGFTQEFNDIFKRESSYMVVILYAFFAIFFLFWKEPFIYHPFIIGIGIISLVYSLLKSEKREKAFEVFNKIDPYLSLILLSGLCIYYGFYLSIILVL
jgi:hypothetical protein